MEEERLHESPAPARVGLADRHPTMRRALASMLAREPQLELIAAVDSWAGVLELLEADSIDVLLLDRRLVEESLARSLQQLAELEPELRVIVLAMTEVEMLRTLALAAGAEAYLLKDSPPSVFAETIRAAAGRAAAPTT